MLVGFDLNSIWILKIKDVTLDLLKFLFIFDYLLESLLYITTAELVIRYLNNTAGEIIYKYFYELLNYPKFSFTSKFEPLAYFLFGLNEFVNTDPKIPQIVMQNMLKKANININSIILYNLNAFFTLL